eukprot:10597799-Lingulodinium_polyedra.AAC.1
MDITERHRAEAHGIAPYKEKDFRAALRGGKDNWQGQVKRGQSAARLWCLRLGLQQTMKFPTSLGESQSK